MRRAKHRDEGANPPDVDAVIKSMKDPRAAARAFLKYDAERSLMNYTRLMWHVLEPGSPLIENWTMHAMCEQLEAISNCEITRWLGNVPPGFSKSTLVQVMWPTWEWGPRNRPDLRMLGWSYASHLTEKAADRSRDLILSPLYQTLWADRFTLDPKQNAKSYYANSAKGFRIATSIDGVGTGERGDRLTLDDPHSVLGGDSAAELQHAINFFGGAFSNRLRNSDTTVKIRGGLRVEPSTIAIIMQRVNKNDVAGQCIAKELGYHHFMVEMEFKGMAHPVRKRIGWTTAMNFTADPRFTWTAHIEQKIEQLAETVEARKMADLAVAAYDALEVAKMNDFVDACIATWLEICHDMAKLADPNRFPRHVVNRMKKELLLKQGTDGAASQLDQWPIDVHGNLIKREWFDQPGRILKLKEVPTSVRDMARGWDFAAKTKKKNDRTATVALMMSEALDLYVMAYHAGRYTPAGVETLQRQTLLHDDEMGWTVIPSIPIDPGQAGESQLANFTKTIYQGRAFDATRETDNKEARFRPVAAQAEHGNLYVVDSPDIEDFLSEICDFPKGDHDDYCDALSRAYDCLIRRMSDSGFFTPELHD